MRLIDADKLQEAIREYFKSHVADSSCMVDGVDCNADICRIVEKAVEQLNKESELADEEKRRMKEISVTERLLNLGPFTGEQKDWKELERWVDTVNKIIYDLKKNKK